MNEDDEKGDQVPAAQNTSHIAIDLSGRDHTVWEKRSSRFFERILNSVKKYLGLDIPSGAPTDPKVLDALNSLSDSALATLKSPQLKNLERQASIKVKVAEAREKEALARKIELESDKLEMDIERERVIESQLTIDRLIQRGELTIIENEDGRLTFIMSDIKSSSSAE
ncbi:MAG: hypothetical protein AAF662_07035 [Pseudomonadota bacterium]